MGQGSIDLGWSSHRHPYGQRETVRTMMMQLGDKPPSADECHCFAARKVARQVSRFYDAHLQPTGLRITQFLTLLVLNELSSATMIELANRLDIEPTAMGKMVGTLERVGLVGIQRSPTDGRSRIVQLTAQGRTAYEQALPRWREAQRDFEKVNKPDG